MHKALRIHIYIHTHMDINNCLPSIFNIYISVYECIQHNPAGKIIFDLDFVKKSYNLPGSYNGAYQWETNTFRKRKLDLLT